jgi:hypothetical protein
VSTLVTVVQSVVCIVAINRLYLPLPSFVPPTLFMVLMLKMSPLLSYPPSFTQYEYSICIEYKYSIGV